MKITDDMLLLMLNTYFDTAFYTPDMKTRVGQVFFKMETVTDEDGDEDDEMMPYIRTSDGKEHLLAEAFAGKLDEEEVKAKLSTLLMTLLSNKMLTQLMRDPFFGVSIDAVNFIPGMPVDWTVGDRYDEDK